MTYQLSTLRLAGAKIILLFGALNKVAGVYGLISAFTGGSISQMSFYIYSSVTLYVVVWGLRAVADVSRGLSSPRCWRDSELISCCLKGIHAQVPQTRPPLRSRPHHPDDLCSPVCPTSVVRDPSRWSEEFQLSSAKGSCGPGHLSTRDPGRETVEHGRDCAWIVGAGKGVHRFRPDTCMAAQGEPAAGLEVKLSASGGYRF